MSPVPSGNPARSVLLVKLGGSLITDKQGREAARLDTLERLARELADGLPAARDRGLTVILGHGSGSFGHVAALEADLAAGLDPVTGTGVGPAAGRSTSSEGQARAARLAGASLTQAKAAELHRLVLTALRDAGLAPFSVVPSSALVAVRRHPARLAAEPLALALSAGFLPVVYGDVVTDSERGAVICSTEGVFRAVAKALPPYGYRVTEALWLGDTAGVYDDDGITIPRIAPGASLGGAAGAAGVGATGDQRNLADTSHASSGAAAGTDVTGGMAHRLETTLAMAAAGIPSVIADGNVPGLLARALAGESVPGTRVAATSPPPTGA